jgi:predicted O-methyltransferase YrrM
MKINNFFLKICYPGLSVSNRIFSHLTFRERIILMKLASEQSVRNIVEIGSYLGASAAAFAAGFKRQGLNGSIFCIDTWNNNAMTEGTRNTMAEFLNNISVFDNYIVPIRGWSNDPKVVCQVATQAEKIDLLFIDGDHSLEGALSDWKSYYPLLSEHAIVAMHDIGWAEGVQRVVMEEIKPRVVREGRLPNLWWGWFEK